MKLTNRLYCVQDSKLANLVPLTRQILYAAELSTAHRLSNCFSPISGSGNEEYPEGFAIEVSAGCGDRHLRLF